MHVPTPERHFPAARSALRSGVAATLTFAVGPALRGVAVAALAIAVASISLPAVDASAGSQDRPRGRDLGVPFDGTPGPLNAITDLEGVEVGHVTLVEGDGARVVGEGPVRTGVTAVWPRGRDGADVPVFAAWFALNGDGEMTGTTWVEDSGLLEGPVMITNTLSVGIVHHAVVRWGVRRSLDWQGDGYPPWLASLPVVAETWDGTLNDIMGQHVTEEHALEAMNGARGGPVEEGNVGGGTGMICHEFKGGIGTASRVVEVGEALYTVGALVQCNYGWRHQLRVAGVPVGREIDDLQIEWPEETTAGGDPDGAGAAPGTAGADAPRPPVGADEEGSIIVVVGTDAPVMPHQLKRIARRISLGLARMGSTSGNGSGDIFMAFSTANAEAAAERGDVGDVRMLANAQLTPLFTATVEATEEAIVNALVAAETMTGADGVTVHALPHDRLRHVLRAYGRLTE